LIKQLFNGHQSSLKGHYSCYQSSASFPAQF
jgi:hypothetical protein